MGDVILIYILIVLCIIIFILIGLLLHKQKIDKIKLKNYNTCLAKLKEDYITIKQNCSFQEQRAKEAEDRYNNFLNKTQENQENLDNFFSQQRTFRQSELDTEFETKTREAEEKLQLSLTLKKQELDIKLAEIEEQAEKNILAARNNELAIIHDVEYQQQKFESLLAPLQQYEKEKQEKIFYTIQIPNEYRNDIDFLLNEVSQKIKHRDIINKLVWAEYIKRYIDDTFKRINIKEEPGIYKLTNINDGKSYIGKSTNVKKRINDHFKSSVGITAIADQAIHHAILKDGIWNWTIEIIIYCNKDQLNELEKYYISFFKTQEWGYNKTGGG